MRLSLDYIQLKNDISLRARGMRDVLGWKARRYTCLGGPIFFPILQQRLVFAGGFAQPGVLSYRRKYSGQSVVCHVRGGRGGIASFRKKESTTSSNTDGTLDETYACLARALPFSRAHVSHLPRGTNACPGPIPRSTYGL